MTLFLSPFILFFFLGILHILSLAQCILFQKSQIKNKKNQNKTTTTKNPNPKQIQNNTKLIVQLNGHSCKWRNRLMGAEFSLNKTLSLIYFAIKATQVFGTWPGKHQISTFAINADNFSTLFKS